MSNTRKGILGTALGLLFGFGFGLFTAGGEFQQRMDPHGYLTSTSSFLPGNAKCPSDCPEDPYTKPGMVFWGDENTGGEDTRYVPFPTSGGALPVMRTAELDKGGVEYWGDSAEALSLATPAFTIAVRDKNEELVGFAKNKTMLFIGSSHDRENVGQFCKAVGGRSSDWGPHAGGQCHVEWLGLTLVNWFLYGMVDNEDADWFAHAEQRPITFERRIPEVMYPGMEKVGRTELNPDLVVFSSLFWDENYMTGHGQQVGYYDNNVTGGVHGFYFEELKWHRSRIQELINYTRNLFGEDIPLMFRTRQHRAYNRMGGVLKIYQLDQSIRSVVREMGVSYFPWGSKLEGWLGFADKDQHYGFGPTTYLFGDMALFYLRQTLVPGCWECRRKQEVGEI